MHLIANENCSKHSILISYPFITWWRDITVDELPSGGVAPALDLNPRPSDYKCQVKTTNHKTTIQVHVII